MELEAGRGHTRGMKTPKKAIDSFAEIATARITLQDTDPPIWREVELPTSITLKVLHDIVQATVGWMDYHLWEFVIDGRTYGLPDDEDWGTAPRKEAAKVRLRDVLKPGETVIAGHGFQQHREILGMAEQVRDIFRLPLDRDHGRGPERFEHAGLHPPVLDPFPQVMEGFVMAVRRGFQGFSDLASGPVPAVREAGRAFAASRRQGEITRDREGFIQRAYDGTEPLRHCFMRLLGGVPAS